MRALYRGMFQRIASTHPLDFYWLWTPEGWTCEIAIPFKSLRFPTGGVTTRSGGLYDPSSEIFPNFDSL